MFVSHIERRREKGVAHPRIPSKVNKVKDEPQDTPWYLCKKTKEGPQRMPPTCCFPPHRRARLRISFLANQLSSNSTSKRPPSLKMFTKSRIYSKATTQDAHQNVAAAEDTTRIFTTCPTAPAKKQNQISVEVWQNVDEKYEKSRGSKKLTQTQAYCSSSSPG